MSKSFREIKGDRIASVATELKRFKDAFEAVHREHVASSDHVYRSHKVAKAKRASLDLSAALVEFRKSRYDEPKTT